MMRFDKNIGKVTLVVSEASGAEFADSVANEFKLLPISRKELLERTDFPKIYISKKYIHIILQFPSSGIDFNKVPTLVEIDFIIGKKFLIMSSPSAYEVVHDFIEAVEEELNEKDIVSGFQLFSVFYRMALSYVSSQITEMKEIMRRISDNIYLQQEDRAIFELLFLYRFLENIRFAMTFHNMPFDILSSHGSKIVTKKEFAFLDDIRYELEMIEKRIADLKDSLTEARSFADTSLNTRVNQVMRLFGVMAYTIAPLGIASTLTNLDIPLLNRFTDLQLFYFSAIVGVLIFLWIKFEKNI